MEKKKKDKQMKIKDSDLRYTVVSVLDETTADQTNVTVRVGKTGDFDSETYGLQKNIDGSTRIPFGSIGWISGSVWTPEDLSAPITNENLRDSSLKIEINRKKGILGIDYIYRHDIHYL